jgi:amidohydrolase
MDGLPVTETADIPYKSTNGNMHACGHDGHMAGMLTAVKILFNERDSFSGTIKVMFQPAEEGLGGAREMIKDGVLEEGKCGPRGDFIYGAHLWTVDPVGCVGCRDGPVMAASDRFDIDVRGKGGHGAAPHQTVDAIVEAAHLITALQTVVSRSIDPLETGVVTVGKVHGGVAYNVICDHVEVTGTCRSFTPEVQQTIESRMSAICCGIASTYGGQIDFKYKKGYPPTVNAYPDEVKNVQNAARPFVGDVRCSWPQRTTGAEDFSYYLLQRPGCFFFVGAALPGPPRPHHKSVFDFDENAMLLSASVFVQLIRSLMVKP